MDQPISNNDPDENQLFSEARSDVTVDPNQIYSQHQEHLDLTVVPNQTPGQVRLDPRIPIQSTNIDTGSGAGITFTHQLGGESSQHYPSTNMDMMIGPMDSASVVRSDVSRCSSLPSIKLKNYAKMAELMATAKRLKQKQALEAEAEEIQAKLELQKAELARKNADLARRRETLELQTAYEQAIAVEDVCNKMEEEVNGRPSLPNYPRVDSLVEIIPMSEQEGRNVNLSNINQQQTQAQPVRAKENERIQINNHRRQDVGVGENQSTTELLLRGIKSMKAEPIKVDKFDGSPLHYNMFIETFKTVYEDGEDSPTAILNQLIGHMIGEPHDLIKGCQFSKDKLCGYRRALELLEDKYGQSFQVKQSYVHKITQGGQMKNTDRDELKKYCMLVLSFKNTLISMGEVHKLNNSDDLKKIARRMPQYLYNRWIVIADRIMYEEKREVTILDVSDFVEKSVRQMDNPLFGDGKDETNQPNSRSRRQQSSFATTTQATSNTSGTTGESINRGNNIKCIMCNDKHYLNRCPKFRRLTYYDRVKFVKTKKLCFSCLRNDHVAANCTRVNPCIRPGCHGQHTTLLHRDNDNIANDDLNLSSSSVDANAENTNSPSQTMCSALNAVNKPSILLPIVPVKVKAHDYLKSHKFIETYALLDNGSDSTYCTQSLANKLGFKGKLTSINRSTMTCPNEQLQTNVYSNVKLSDLFGFNEITVPCMFSQASINISDNSIPKPNNIEKFSYLNQVNLPVINSGVDLIIGNDVSIALEPIKTISSVNNGPFAVQTRLGWVVNGCSGKAPPKSSQTSFFASSEPLCSLCSDYVDCVKYGKMEPSIEQKQFLKNAEDSIKLNQCNHYVVNLPVKHPDLAMPNNKVQAEQRLNSLKKRFMRDKEFHRLYKENMKMMLDNKFAVKANEEPDVDGKTWYLPHHGVQHAKKPGKLRIVFDCSAKFAGMSLNDNLIKGPDLTNTLLGVLLRFRQEQIAFQADIKAMFYQVEVPDEFTGYLKYLWWPDGNYDLQPEVYKMKTHLFGTVSSPGIANFALHQVGKDHKDEISDETYNCIMRNFYVDDILKSVSSPDVGRELIHELKSVLNQGGFNLSKFVSNCPNILSNLSEDDCAVNNNTIKICNEETEHLALGIKWNVTKDSFNQMSKPNTRRGILSVINSLFDPVGWACPFILIGKLILQELNTMKLGWDDKCSDEHMKQWDKWISDLEFIKSFNIPRCLKPNEFGEVTNVQVHIFSDASNHAISSVAYLRITNKDEKIHTTILMAKSRLVPHGKRITMPRLELSAAALSLQLDKTLRNEMDIPINSTTFWVDSTAVLYYIHNRTKSYPTFVANRINKIHDTTSVSQWKYICTKDNIADVATRGLTGQKFIGCDKWVNGPDFLGLQEEKWPKQLIEFPSTDSEEVKQQINMSQQIDHSQAFMNKLFTQFSDWTKLRRVVAVILRYKEILLKRIRMKNCQSIETKNKQVKNTKPEFPLITVDEIKQAEFSITQYIQQREFNEKLKALSSNKPIKKSSKIIKLNPIIVDGLIRVGGRINRSDLSYDQRHPIILTKNMPIVTLIVTHYHKLVGHGGRAAVLSQLRSQYWITSANSLVRSVLNTCVTCKKIRGSSAQQFMSELPKNRLQCDTPPFANVGVDYFGPFNIRLGRNTYKRYGVIFTCMVTRAVHIEISTELSTDCFIMALRRFMSRRGPPDVIHSDNGTNFVGAVNEMKKNIKEWNQHQINNYLLQSNVKWIFNPPAASHYGGAWERLIRSIRQILLATTSQQRLTDESLYTFMCEAEAIINNRPLTYVSPDPNDLQPLSPSDLLLLRSNKLLPPGQFDKSDSCSRKRWRHVQYLSNIFWSRFKDEYMTLLQNRHKWQQINRNIQTNDIVLLVNNNLPRNNWMLGRVLKTFPDTQNLIRKVEIKTKDGLFIRPITKLCLLLPNQDNV